MFVLFSNKKDLLLPEGIEIVHFSVSANAFFIAYRVSSFSSFVLQASKVKSVYGNPLSSFENNSLRILFDIRSSCQVPNFQLLNIPLDMGYEFSIHRNHC